MNDFSVFRSSFDDCWSNMSNMLKRCREKNLILNWKKFRFMIKKKEGIVLRRIISKDGIEVDKAKADLIVNLSPSTCVKEARSFLQHASFYRRFIKDFSKISNLLTNLLAKTYCNVPKISI